jgi:hypothetical protein
LKRDHEPFDLEVAIDARAHEIELCTQEEWAEKRGNYGNSLDQQTWPKLGPTEDADPPESRCALTRGLLL